MNQRKHESAEETRQNILSVAEKLFMEHGYRAVSTRQVAEQCGISQPTLYYHFSNKQELYLAIVLETLKRLEIAMNSYADATDNIEIKLTGVARYLLRLTKKEMDVPVMLHDIEGELDENKRQLVESKFYISMVAPLVKILAEGREQIEAERQRLGLPSVTQMPLETQAFVFFNMIISANHDNNAREINTTSNVNNEVLAAELTQFFLYGFFGQSK